jgi:asparagine synthase (glutamine-hydrolysing)
VLLSGGLDSSTVAASLAEQAGSGVASFTVRFPDAHYDEGPLARDVAGKWRLESHEMTIAPDELPKLVEEACWYNDEPSAHASDAHLLAISRYAKPRATVLLSGEGADELLGGYVRYRPLQHPTLVAVARPLLPTFTKVFGVNGRVRKLSRFTELDSMERFVVYNPCEILPADVAALGFQPKLRFPYREQIFGEAEKLYPGDLLRQVMYCDQHAFLCSILDRNDRMTMGRSIECRVPFLDHRLVEGATRLPTDALVSARSGKRIVRRALGWRLPRAVLQGRKWGFDVPWRTYFRHTPALREIVETLPDREPCRSGPFDRRALRATVARFLAGDDSTFALVRQLVMVHAWYGAVGAR